MIKVLFIASIFATAAFSTPANVDKGTARTLQNNSNVSRLSAKTVAQERRWTHGEKNAINLATNTID